MVKKSRYRPRMTQSVPGRYGKGIGAPLQTWHGPENSRNLM